MSPDLIPDLSNKQLLALNCVAAFLIVGLAASLLWPKLRDPALFVVIFGAVFVRKWMDVSFGGIWWYRGTTRGFEFSGIDLAAWCILGATLLVPRYRNHRIYFPAGVGLWLLYFGYCFVSVLNSDPQIYGWWELSKHFRALLILITAALFIRTPRELSVMVFAFGCSIWFLGLNAIEQRVFKHVLRPPATLDHENSLSMYLCTVAPLMVAATMARWPWWFRIFCGLTCILAVIGEVLTASRTGMPVLAFGMLGTAIFCTSWRLTRRKALTILGCVAAAGLLLVGFWDRITVRYKNNASMEELMGDGGFESRSQFWTLAKMIVKDRPHGVGLNNWSYDVSKIYASRLGIRYNDYDEIRAPLDRDADAELQPIFAPPAHSITALTLGELGTAGLVLLMLVFLRWFQMGASFLRGRLNPDPMHRLGIGLLFCTAGMFLHSVTEWTYRQTQIMFTFHVLMGALAALYYQKSRAKREARIEARRAKLASLLIPATPEPLVPVRRET